MRIRAPIGVSFQVWKARWAALIAASTSCGGGERNFGQHLLGGRVDDVVPFGGLGLDPLAVDQQLDLLHGGFVWRERCVHVGLRTLLLFRELSVEPRRESRLEMRRVSRIGYRTVFGV